MKKLSEKVLKIKILKKKSFVVWKQYRRRLFILFIPKTFGIFWDEQKLGDIN